MSGELLRKCLKEAKEKNQVGLIVWQTQKQWRDCADEFKKGNKTYDYVTSQVRSGQEVYLGFSWAEKLEWANIRAISVQKISYDDELFNKFLDTCKTYQGPVLLIPSNQIAECC